MKKTLISHKPQIHAKEKHAWIDGAKIEVQVIDGNNKVTWSLQNSPEWYKDNVYRVQPEKKFKKIKMWHFVIQDEDGNYHETTVYFHNKKSFREYYKSTTCVLFDKVIASVIELEIEVER